MRSAKLLTLDHSHHALNLLFRGGKFMAVAWLGMVVNTACLFLFKGILRIPIIPAGLMAIEIAIVHNFIWLRHWAWRDRTNGNHSSFFRQLLLYNLFTGAVDILANLSILWSLSTLFSVHYLLANALGMIAGPFIKFWVNEKIVFKEA
ncbi:MAG: GtrA family protein [bacterium]|nr:GtrA family protein [bacterium]